MSPWFGNFTDLTSGNYSNQWELRRVSDAIRALVPLGQILPPSAAVTNEEEDAEEGRLLSRAHRFRERDPSIIGRKKHRALQQQKSLSCEVCKFDFEKVYGERGYGFIECHHTKPLSELSPEGATTKLADLSLVCSNCHRMIHKSKPWLSMDQLRELLQQGN